MGFVKAKYKSVEEYVKSVQQDLIIPVNTVHDEINYGVEKFLLKPLLKRLIEKITAKNIIDGFGHPYMNFLYDTEYNPQTGAFTGEGFEGVESFTPYTYPKRREEKNAKESWETVIKRFSSKKDSKPSSKEIILPYECVEGIDLTKYHKKRGYTLIVERDGKKYKYKTTVSKRIKKVCR